MTGISTGRALWPVPLVLGVAASVTFVSTDSAWLQAAMYLGTYLIGTVLLLRTWWRHRATGDRQVIGLFAVGAILYLAASAAFWAWPLLMGRALPLPSAVDVLFFASYAAFAVLLTALALRHRNADPRASMDAVIVMLGLLPAGYLALVDPLLNGRPLDRATAVLVAYPVAVAVLVTLAMWLAFVGSRRSAPYLLLGGWIGMELIADIVFARRGIAGTYANGQSWQVLWVLSAACIGSLALHPRALELADGEAGPQVRPRRRLLILGAALTGPLLALLYAEERQLDRAAVSVCGITGIVVIILTCVRLWGLMTEVAEQRHLLSELGRLSNDLKFQALHDPLTGLGNRTMFGDRVDHALAQRVVAHDRAAAVLLLDLDDFKAVNDSLGHDAGDVVLIEVARRLEQVTRQGESVIRLGGDEFAIVLERACLTDALRLADRVQAALQRPMDVGPRTVRPYASIGIAIALRGQDRIGLLTEADIAMYAAKGQAGARPAVFDPELHREVLERHRLESDLREAAARDELRLVYQPIVELATNDMVGVEALVRWEHPTRGMISPLDFIPLAETNGTILGIGDWVLAQACRQMLCWDRDQPDRPLRVSINVSPRQLADPEFVRRASAILCQAGLDAARITLEVTESALGIDTETMITRLDELKQLGVFIAIDDFGTGYSSLSHLRRLPVDMLKIDRSFVTGIAREPAEWALTTAIVRLARSLGKTTLAEGIETGAQLAHLRGLNVELGQGYLFSKPVSAAAVTELAAATKGEAFRFD